MMATLSLECLHSDFHFPCRGKPRDDSDRYNSESCPRYQFPENALFIRHLYVTRFKPIASIDRCRVANNFRCLAREYGRFGIECEQRRYAVLTMFAATDTHLTPLLMPASNSSTLAIFKVFSDSCAARTRVARGVR